MIMKKYLFAGTLFFAFAAQAQKTPVKSKQNAATLPRTSLRNLTDSVSYAIGLMVGNFYKQQGVKSLNSSIVGKAITDVYSGKKTMMNESQANNTVMLCMNPNLSKNISAGENFLKENKKNPKIKATPSGLQYEVITEGT